MENGVGGIDADRFARSIEQIAMTYEFKGEPDIAAYFTDAYLPDDGSRMMQ
jgi:NitT/TauT family transport system substrate-binding protein